MKDKNFRRTLNDLKIEALQYRGMSIKGNMKHIASIPADAHMELPAQFHGDKELLKEWLRYHHPYLIVSRFWTIKGETRRYLKL